MNNSTPKTKLPIGIQSYEMICDLGYYYVDKTLLVKEVLDAGPQVTLFTRPRRFGKSLGMDMLRTFFEKTDRDTSRYFRERKIWECGPEYTGRQGQYPVISLSFAGTESETLEEALDMIREVLQAEYRRHLDNMRLGRLSSFYNERMAQFAYGASTAVNVRRSLVDLSETLHKYHGAPPVILIDEYDTPIESAWEHGYYSQMVGFMRDLLSPALKGNRHLSFACLTGVLRVAKEGLFSGLNNLDVDGVLDSRYDECFGFTPEEVQALAECCGAEDSYEELRHWYQGYLFGEQEVFNPWSVLMYFHKGRKPDTYWSNTTSSGALGELLRRADPKLLEGLRAMLGGQTAWSAISGSLVYPDLDAPGSNVAVAAYTLLLMSGYLTTTGATRDANGKVQHELVIPNEELRRVYAEEILDTMPREFDEGLRGLVEDALTAFRENEAQGLQGALSELLKRSVSCFDLDSEKEYQMWLLGLLASMPGYRVTSNREAGEGRFDVCLVPLARRLPGVIIEVKTAKKKKKKEQMPALAAKGVQQMRDKDYAAELRAQGVREILEFGIAFRGKAAFVTTGSEVDAEAAAGRKDAETNAGSAGTAGN